MADRWSTDCFLFFPFRDARIKPSAFLRLLVLLLAHRRAKTFSLSVTDPRVRSLAVHAAMSAAWSLELLTNNVARECHRLLGSAVWLCSWMIARPHSWLLKRLQARVAKRRLVSHVVSLVELLSFRRKPCKLRWAIAQYMHGQRYAQKASLPV